MRYNSSLSENRVGLLWPEESMPNPTLPFSQIVSLFGNNDPLVDDLFDYKITKYPVIPFSLFPNFRFHHLPHRALAEVGGHAQKVGLLIKHH